MRTQDERYIDNEKKVKKKQDRSQVTLIYAQDELLCARRRVERKTGTRARALNGRMPGMPHREAASLLNRRRWSCSFSFLILIPH